MRSIFSTVRRFGAAAFRRMFSRRGLVGLTTSEIFSLYMIGMMDAPTIKQFSSYLGISQPNATYKINALVEKGYIEKRPSLVDRREYHLYTTKKCRKLLIGEERNVEELEAALKSRFTDGELETARSVFEALLELLEQE